MSILIAVETSDIVGSTKLTTKQLNDAMTALKECIKSLSDQQQVVAEFYRGDAFQLMYPNAAHSFRHLLLIKLYLLSVLDYPVKITQSLALGAVSGPIESLNNRMDEVFIQSGRQLETLDKGTIGIVIKDFTDGDRLALAFLNCVIEQLSAKQALVLYWYIKQDFPEHKKIAAYLKMSRQNVNTHLLRAKANLIKQFIFHFEKTVNGVAL